MAPATDQPYSRDRSGVARALATGSELDQTKQALQHLAGAVAHDLANPLTAIQGLAQILVKRLEGDEQDLALRILRSADRATALVESMIDDVRTAVAPHRSATVDLVRPVAWAVRQVHAELSDAGGQLHFDRLPSVRANEVLLRHLFVNIFANAVKYRRPDRPPQIRITCERRDGWWEVAVADNGRGIPASEREAVFEPGTRVHDDVDGHGIGLAAVRAIAERHGGWAWAEGNPAGGTTIRVTLPAAEERSA